MFPTTLTKFGDVCLEELGIVVEYVHDDPPEARVDTTEVPGMDGVMATGSTLAERTITLDCRAFESEWGDFDSLMERLALLVGKCRELEVRSHPGEAYTAYLTSIAEGEREGGRGIGSFTMTFMAPDPTRRGRVRRASVQPGEGVHVVIGGTCVTNASVSVSGAVRDPESLVWGMRFDEDEFVHVALSSDTPRDIEIDCEERTVSVDGENVMLTLDSDWIWLEPGIHTARMDQGTGDAVITWTERSL